MAPKDFFVGACGLHLCAMLHNPPIIALLRTGMSILLLQISNQQELKNGISASELAEIEVNFRKLNRFYRKSKHKVPLLNVKSTGYL